MTPRLSLFFLALALTAIAQPAKAPAMSPALSRLEKSPRHHEWVDLKSGDHKVQTFVAYPEVKDKAMVVLVIHENRGLNDWARAVADRLAENGYIAVAPDLLTGLAPGGRNTADFPTQGDATKAIGQLKPESVLADLNTVAEYAKSLPSASGRIAVAGFCWGGGQVWRLALNRTDLVLACTFYGTAPGDADFAKISAPVRGFYGGNDARVDATLEKTADGMLAAKKSFEPVTYEGAGHAFMRIGEDADASPANKAAMQQGWSRLLVLLASARQP